MGIKSVVKKFNIIWLNYLRKAIEQKIIEEKKKDAARSMDEIRNKTKYGSFDSTLSIREDRDT